MWGLKSSGVVVLKAAQGEAAAAARAKLPQGGCVVEEDPGMVAEVKAWARSAVEAGSVEETAEEVVATRRRVEKATTAFDVEDTVADTLVAEETAAQETAEEAAATEKDSDSLNSDDIIL